MGVQTTSPAATEERRGELRIEREDAVSSGLDAR
jgi:hypothetical protein